MAVNKTVNKRTNSHGAMRNCIEYGGVKSTGKLYQQRKVYRKNETVWMECELDGKEKAHHVPESGWKESA